MNEQELTELDVEIVEGEIVDEDVGEGQEPLVLDPRALGVELPEDPEEAQNALLVALAQTRAEADGFLEDLRRLAAEFDNYRKRSQREQTAHLDRASQRLVETLLPVLDSFDGAFSHDPQTPTEEKLVSGMKSTYHQLLDILNKEGLEIIPSLGERFDPEVHEAVTAANGGDGSLVVTQELRRGYRLKDRVIRPALVAVDNA